jgi:hypothetical protein
MLKLDLVVFDAIVSQVYYRSELQLNLTCIHMRVTIPWFGEVYYR